MRRHLHTRPKAVLAAATMAAGILPTEADRKYIAEKGMETIRRHCEDFVRTRLAPANPPNDGKASSTS